MKAWTPPDGPLLSNDMPPEVLRLPRTWQERYLANFVRRLEWNGECLDWTGSIANTGYGVYRSQGAHIVAYELWVGPVPKGKLVRHDCDRPRCAAPWHLRLGSHAANMGDKVSRGRARGGLRPGQIGELNNAAKVSTEQAQFALDLYAAGYRQVDIARLAGLTPSNNHNIVRRETWTHLFPNADAIREPPLMPRRVRRPPTRRKVCDE
jgi:HNH endonuclease